MQKCKNCKCEAQILLIKLTDTNSTETYCPNCLALAFCENKLNFQNNPNFIDDITGKPGAVKFESNDESYSLEKETMLRLISYNLKPNEYFALADKYGNDKYMLHDDFYTEDGIAWQPIES